MTASAVGAECPTRDELESFARGHATDLNAMMNHVNDCEHCRAALAEIYAENSLLGHVARAGPHDTTTSSPTLAQAIEGYRLIEEIHRGAQGVVFRAEQIATRRIVAVKLLHQGAFASALQRSRFEREVELAASLDHPNIVTVYDSGRTADGGFYLAMEFIDAAPLKTLGVEPPSSRAAVREILRRFVDLCNAVNAAHQRGVIHRDLKPANILIGKDGRPHVLDFGVARRQDAVDDQAAMSTMEGQFVGTFAYAAPEQVSGEPSQIDIRCDVYALGVILYEWLTAQRPISVSGSLENVIRAIRESAPPRASSLNPAIGRDIDAILHGAMEKNRLARYESAGALARDVQRFLEGRPVEARAESRWYVARKFVLRHKAATVLVAGVSLGLISGTAVVTKFWLDAVESKRVAVLSDEAKGRALQSIVGLFSSKELRDKVGDEMIKAYLVESGRVLQQQLGDQPDAWGTFKAAGDSQLFRNEYEPALEQFDVALRLLRSKSSPDDADVAELLHNRGQALFFLNRLGEAEASYREALAMRIRLFGELHADVARSTGHLAATLRKQGRMTEADPLYRRDIEIRRSVFGDESEQLAESVNNYAYFLLHNEDYERALQHFELARSIAEACHADLVHIAAIQNNIANCLLMIEPADHDQRIANLNRAERELDDALMVKLKKFDDTNNRVLVSRQLRALILEARGDYAEALKEIDAVLKAWKRIFPEGGPSVDQAQAVFDRIGALASPASATSPSSP